MHLLALLDHQTSVVLSQTEMDRRTDEYKAALKLLKTLVLEGRLIIGDAMFCQRDLCKQITDSGGEYLIDVKENQPELKASIEDEFRPGFPPYTEKPRQQRLSETTTVEKRHGRIVKRKLQTSTRFAEHSDWPGFRQVCKLERTTRSKAGETLEVCYFITSLVRDRAEAAALLQYDRDHWKIENQLHWVRDVAMGEARLPGSRRQSSPQPGGLTQRGPESAAAIGR